MIAVLVEEHEVVHADHLAHGPETLAYGVYPDGRWELMVGDGSAERRLLDHGCQVRFFTRVKSTVRWALYLEDS